MSKLSILSGAKPSTETTETNVTTPNASAEMCPRKKCIIAAVVVVAVVAAFIWYKKRH